jgi:hypothetical protein
VSEWHARERAHERAGQGTIERRGKRVVGRRSMDRALPRPHWDNGPPRSSSVRNGASAPMERQLVEDGLARAVWLREPELERGRRASKRKWSTSVRLPCCGGRCGIASRSLRS